jgi:small conductance mechanosensitive channel
MPDEIPIHEIESAVLNAAVPIIVIVIGALVALRFARPLIRKILRRVLLSQTLSASAERQTAADIHKRVDTIETFGLSAIRFVIAVLVVALVLAVLNLGWVVGALGFVFAALAFAGQDFVRDYLAGVFILVENQFYVGDVIEVTGITGTVEDFTLRRTTLRDLHGTLHIVSNGEIRIASNHTRVFAGINLDVPIAYDANVELALTLIREVGEALAADEPWAGRILEAPVAVRVNAFGDIGMFIKVLGKVRAGDQWAVTGELRRRVVAAFATAGISMASRRIVIERNGEEADDARSTVAAEWSGGHDRRKRGRA